MKERCRKPVLGVCESVSLWVQCVFVLLPCVAYLPHDVWQSIMGKGADVMKMIARGRDQHKVLKMKRKQEAGNKKSKVLKMKKPE